ncbi:TCP-1/cpn60 chaperonin family protein, partial [Salmonella sp. s51228]|uniref:TCP-1/cpn60 chaperonin family protein n=1 Tax=Salmonella sp. s51228 TaxID=3159652 RepID=UPI0039804F4A
MGLDIVRTTLKTPCYFIAYNAGFNAEEVVSKVLQSETNVGMNALTGEYVDMIKSGIIDPTKVVRTALIDSAGVASLLITAECVVTELP